MGAGVNELYAEAACDTNFMIRGLVVFALASACLWAADDPLDLLRQAHVAVDKGKFKEAVKLADDANMIWSANAAGHEADYADVLVTEALALLAPDFKHGFPGRDSEQVGIWESQSADLLDRASAIPEASAPVRAMALDLECLQPRNRPRLDQLLHEAREMHAKAVAEILPVREDVDAQPSWPAKSKGTEAPKLIKKTEPAYALLAKGLMVRGVVLLSIVIEADGTPSSATLKKRLGWGLFWFSVKLRREEAAEGEIPPYGRGFSRHEDLSSDLLFAA